MTTSAELTLSEMAPGGEAVGRRDDGLVVFVAGGTPGDRVEVALDPPRKGYAHGRLLRVLSPGAERVEPACALSVPDRCGGCPLMAVARPSQLAAKESWVRRALRKLPPPLEILPILAPAPDLGYRLRARVEVRGGRLGFAGARSHRVTEISACPVLVPSLERALFGGCAPLAPLLGEGATVQGLAGDDGGVQLAVSFGAGAQRRAARARFEALIREGVVDCVLYEGEDSEAAVVLGTGEWGPFYSTADGFAQPSAPGHSLLPQLVADAAFAPPTPAAPRVLELFSGSGNLSRALRPRASLLHCVEGEPRAARRAQRLFSGDAAVTVEARPVETALRALASAGAGFDVVVLDPPRTGAREAVPLLRQLGSQRIVYVSCDPMTLGRDLGELAAAGYVARTVQPIDLTPQAAHVESLAVAERA